MEKDESSMKMDKFTMESGKRAKLVVRESSSAWMARCMMASGSMISTTARVPSSGSIIKSNIQVTIKMAKRLVKVNSSLMEMSMKVIFLMDNSMDTENTISLNQARNMKASLRRI